MFLFRYITIISCLGISLTQYQQARADYSENVRTAAIVTAVIVGSYLLGRICASVSHNNAQERYAATSQLVKQEQPEETIRQELRKHIQADNIAHHEYSTSPLRNYPLVQYTKDIDWYIHNLPWLNGFTHGSPLHEEIPASVSDLKQIKRLVITEPTYIEERRKADEYIASINHVHQHNVVVRHRR